MFSSTFSQLPLANNLILPNIKCSSFQFVEFSAQLPKRPQRDALTWEIDYFCGQKTINKLKISVDAQTKLWITNQPTDSIRIMAVKYYKKTWNLFYPKDYWLCIVLIFNQCSIKGINERAASNSNFMGIPYISFLHCQAM